MSGGQAAGDGSGATGTKGLARSRWLSRRAIRLHLTLLIAGSGCLAAGWFEFTRARAGNELSWVYVFEWPFFAGFGCYLWWRLLHEDDRSRARPAADPAGPSPMPDDSRAQAGSAAPGEPADPQLQAWNEYLARLHARDPAGGPPGERRAQSGDSGAAG